MFTDQKEEKKKALKELRDRYDELDENNYEVKTFYLQLIIELQNKPLYTVRSLSKILVIIAVILSFIPFIS